MGFRVEQLVPGKDGTIGRKIISTPFETSEEAEACVEGLISNYERSGYDEKQKSWWGRNAKGVAESLRGSEPPTGAAVCQ